MMPKKDGFWDKFWPSLIVGLILALVSGLISWRAAIATERRASDKKLAELRETYQRDYTALVETFSNRLGELVIKGGNVASSNPSGENLEVAGRAIFTTRDDVTNSLVSLSAALDHEIDELKNDISNMQKNPNKKSLQDKVRKDLLVLREKWPSKKELIQVQERKVLVEFGIVPTSSPPEVKLTPTPTPTPTEDVITTRPSPLVQSSISAPTPEPLLPRPGSTDDNEIYVAGQNGVTSPTVTSKPSPRYSQEAHNANIEGVVRVSAVFRKDGSIADVKVVKKLGYRLDEEAIIAARQIKFTPGQKDGKPVNVRMTLEYTFHIT